jgi:hypothetical protein
MIRQMNDPLLSWLEVRKDIAIMTMMDFLQLANIQDGECGGRKFHTKKMYGWMEGVELLQ